MLTSSVKINKYANLAYEDIWHFLDHSSTNDPGLSFWWKNAQSQVSQLDPRCSAANAQGMRDFVQPFLEWLEQRRNPVELPWLTQGARIHLDSQSSCAGFLVALHSFLDELSHPVEKKPYGKQVKDQLRRFVRLTAVKQLACKVIFKPKPKNLNLHGFASWLIVDKFAALLYVMYDSKQIHASVAGDIVVRRLEKVLLHELGHARAHLNYYLTAEAPGGVVRSRAADETSAWLYALTIRSYVSSSRSRISRLLGECDNEWK